ncbi:MAG: tetratricopeptide repeat protein, partial [bacterium]|nr:tetratricopeptide repeat protein [bacterium]
AQALGELRSYVAQSRWPVVDIAWEPPEQVAVQLTPLSDTEAQTAQLDLQMSMGLWEVSRTELEKLARAKGETPEIESARGMLAMSRREFNQAQHHLERSIALGSRQASTYFEYAMLLRETSGDRARVAEYLRRTVALNPNHAEAHFLLGVMAATDNRHAEAIESLRLATGIRPRQANFWHALALSYRKTGQRELASRSARRALDAARTPQETDMARAAIRLTQTPEPVHLTGRPAVHTPATWFNKQGDSRAEGELVRIDCVGEAARFHVRTSAETLALWVPDPGKVLLKNISSVTFQFACGDLDPRTVRVEYTARVDDTSHTAGDVTSIEFGPAAK